MKNFLRVGAAVALVVGMGVWTAEQCQAGLINVALGKPASQSTTMGSFVAANAVDGNLNNFTHTWGNASDANPWWQVNLGGGYLIQQISLENRRDCCQLRLQDTRVQILGADGATVVWDSGILYPGPIYNNSDIPLTTTLNLTALAGGPVRGNYVKVSRTGGNPPTGGDHDKYALSLAEVVVSSNIITTGGTAPGGFARLGASSEVLYHLDAAKGVQTSGSQVTQWNDQSGRNNHFSQSDPNRQPTYQTSGFGGNNLPSLHFDGSNDQLTLSTATSPVTVFLVNKPDAVENLQGIWGSSNPSDKGIRINVPAEPGGQYAWRYPGDGNDFTNPQGSSMYINGEAGNSFGNLSVSHILTALRSAASPTTYNVTHLGGYYSGRAFMGDIAEVLVFNRALNLAEIRVVENHLSAKYAIPLAAGANFYAGDDPAKGDYDLDVFGVGRVDAANKLLEAGAAGFGFQAVDGSLGDGEFLMAGHKKPTNAWVSTDLPAGSGIRLRWDRVWYVDATGTTDALFAFGFTDGGLSPQTLQPAEYYALLYSPTNAFQFSVLAAGQWNGPDQIFFTLSASQIQDGYYTLGIAVPEPASLVLLVLGAVGLLLVRRRLA